MKINICGIGDPIDPKVWSGTPYNIYTELLKTGNLAIQLTNKHFLSVHLSFSYPKITN